MQQPVLESFLDVSSGKCQKVADAEFDTSLRVRTPKRLPKPVSCDAPSSGQSYRRQDSPRKKKKQKCTRRIVSGLLLKNTEKVLEDHNEFVLNLVYGMNTLQEENSNLRKQLALQQCNQQKLMDSLQEMLVQVASLI